MQEPKITIILLNWNGWKDSIECIESIYNSNYGNFDLVLVDNDSTDNSIDKIVEYCNGKIIPESNYNKHMGLNKPLHYSIIAKKDLMPEDLLKNNMDEDKIKNLYVISNDNNDGFAEGNNIGIRFAIKYLHPNFVLLLNNDTYIDRNLLPEMVRVTTLYPDIGIVGPKSYHYDDPKTLGCTGGIINYWTGIRRHLYAGQEDIGQFKEIQERDFISGTCMLISIKLTSADNVLDPIFYFGGGEDVDISLRARENHLKVVSTPYAILWHKGESKKGLTMDKRRLQLYAYYYIRNNLLLIKKHWKGIKLISVTLCIPLTFVSPMKTFIKNKWSVSLLKEPFLGVIDLILNKK